MNALLFMPLLLAALVGYMLGSIPFGLLLTRAAGLGDIRAIGSGNIGATNVLRTGNKGLAAFTLLLDILKGTVAVLAAAALLATGSDPTAVAVAAGIGAFLGHLFPVWLGFKGGKGVATYVGVLLGLTWKLAIVFCALWLVVAFVSRYSSLSALVASLAVPVAAYVLAGPIVAVAAIAMTALLVWKHATNISRLLAGKEPRIGGRMRG